MSLERQAQLAFASLPVASIAKAIRESYSAPGMPRDWRAGCDAACERIARQLAEGIDSRAVAAAFVAECQPVPRAIRKGAPA